MTDTDEMLVRRFRSGDDLDGVFRDILARYGALTHAFFKRRIGNEDLAAEQNQELYLSVVRHLHGFRFECSFRSWLFSLAHNRVRQFRRRLQVHADERPEDLPEAVWDRFAGKVLDDPEDNASRKQRSSLLKRCLARLSEIERLVVCGQYYHHKTLRELSGLLRMENPSGARATLIAAQRKLRKCLEAAGVTGAEGGAP